MDPPHPPTLCLILLYCSSFAFYKFLLLCLCPIPSSASSLFLLLLFLLLLIFILLKIRNWKPPSTDAAQIPRGTFSPFFLPYSLSRLSSSNKESLYELVNYANLQTLRWIGSYIIVVGYLFTSCRPSPISPFASFPPPFPLPTLPPHDLLHCCLLLLLFLFLHPFFSSSYNYILFLLLTLLLLLLPLRYVQPLHTSNNVLGK